MLIISTLRRSNRSSERLSNTYKVTRPEREPRFVWKQRLGLSLSGPFRRALSRCMKKEMLRYQPWGDGWAWTCTPGRGSLRRCLLTGPEDGARNGVTNLLGCSRLRGFLGHWTCSTQTGKVLAKLGQVGHPSDDGAISHRFPLLESKNLFRQNQLGRGEAPWEVVSSPSWET